MKRRDFFKATAAVSAAAFMLPGTLLAETTRKANQGRFPKPLVPKMDNQW